MTLMSFSATALQFKIPASIGLFSAKSRDDEVTSQRKYDKALYMHAVTKKTIR